MDSDEQRSPWLPVQPEGKPSEDAPTPADAIERVLAEPAPPRPSWASSPTAAPAFDDLIAPSSSSADAFPTTPAREAALPSAFTPPAYAPPAYAPSTEAPSAYAPPAAEPPAPSVPARSPYLSAERPRPQYGAYEQPAADEPPAAAGSAQEAWGPDRRAIPTANPPAEPLTTGSIPTFEAATALAPSTSNAPGQAQEPVFPASSAPVPAATFAAEPVRNEVTPSKPSVPFAPWTGAIPVVEPVRIEDEAPPVELAPPTAPFAPPRPALGLIPEPIEVDDADIIAPTQPPSASEIQPLTEHASGGHAGNQTPWQPSWSEPDSQASTTEFTPDAADPVRQLGASALSTASLEAAGAPTPRGGIPLVNSGNETVPSFGEGEPFVPRFEPIGGVVSAPAPSVSFAAPTPAPRPFSPLSDVAVPESDEPAYVPRVDLVATDRTHVIDDEPAALMTLPQLDDATDPDAGPIGPFPTSSAHSIPAKPWTTLDPQDVEHASGDPLGPEADAATGDVDGISQPFAASTAPVTGSTPAVASAASFFASTRDARAAEGLAEHATGEHATGEHATGEHVVAEQATDEHAVDEHEADVSPASALLATAPPATARTPSQGAWEASAVATETPVTNHSDTETTTVFARVTEGPLIQETEHDMPGTDTNAADEQAAIHPAHSKPGRKRLMLWIVLAAVAAVVVGVVAYRLFFQPEPVVLPVPTVMASAAAPTSEPVTIDEATPFAASMPAVVGTDVLISYENLPVAGDATLPARAAEHLTLEYGPGADDAVFTVEAYQHYSEEAALTAYDVYAGDAVDVEDVVVDGETVGERALSASGAQGTLVWRNGTAVIVATGPADSLLNLFDHFGV